MMLTNANIQRGEKDFNTVIKALKKRTMKNSKKKQLQDLLTGSKESEKIVFLDNDEKAPKNHKGPVIRFVDFAKQNEKLKAG